MMRTKALIAVRGGSVRVPNKNIKPFAGSNLLEIKINQLKRIPNLNGIIVNSDDDGMLNTAFGLGCEVVKRNACYANNEVSMSDVYMNMAEQSDCEVIAYTNVTNPLITDKSIIHAIELFHAQRHIYDSINSAHLIKEFLFKDNAPINYDLSHQPKSQDLPDIYALNFAINVIAKASMIKCKNVVGNKPFIYAIDEVEATDIDTPLDFEFSEFIYRKFA